MTTCSPSFSVGFARTCLQQNIPVKVASLWLWQKRLGEAMEKPAFAYGLLTKLAAVEGAPVPTLPMTPPVDRGVINDLGAEIAEVDKQAAAFPEKRAALMLVRSNLQRRLNAYVMGE